MLRTRALVGWLALSFVAISAVAGPDAADTPRTVDVDLRPERMQTKYEISFVRQLGATGFVFLWTRVSEAGAAMPLDRTFGLYRMPGEGDAPSAPWTVGEVPAELLERVKREHPEAPADRLTCRVGPEPYEAVERTRRAWVKTLSGPALNRTDAAAGVSTLLVEVARILALDLPPAWRTLSPEALVDAWMYHASDVTGAWRVRWSATKDSVEASIRKESAPDTWDARRRAFQEALRRLRMEIRGDGSWVSHEGEDLLATGTWCAAGHAFLLTLSDEHAGRVDRKEWRLRLREDGLLDFDTGPFVIVWERTTEAAPLDEPETWVSLRFVLPIDLAIHQKRLAANIDREELLRETLDVIRRRLDAVGMRKARLRPLPNGKFELRVPDLDAEAVERLIFHVSATGRLRFRIEVLPTELYSSWREDIPRLLNEADRPWQGTKAHAPDLEGFESFKKAEVERWKFAHANAAAYEPFDARYLLVQAEDTDGSQVEHFHVLEAPVGKDDPVHRFGHGMLENAVASTSPNTGRPVALYDIRSEFQNAFREWTSRNTGLPLAIVLEGTWRMAPVLHGALTDKVQITLETGVSYAEQRHQAQRLAGMIAGGVLELRPVLESVARNVEPSSK